MKTMRLNGRIIKVRETGNYFIDGSYAYHEYEDVNGKIYVTYCPDGDDIIPWERSFEEYEENVRNEGEED